MMFLLCESWRHKRICRGQHWRAFLHGSGPVLNTVVALPGPVHVRNPAGSFLASKTGWMLIQGTYTGAGEEHLTSAISIMVLTPLSFPRLRPVVHDGNSYYYLDAVTVKASVPSCGNNKTVQCGTPWSFDRPKVSGSCCSNTSVTLISSNLISYAPPCRYVYQGVWRATGLLHQLGEPAPKP